MTGGHLKAARAPLRAATADNSVIFKQFVELHDDWVRRGAEAEQAAEGGGSPLKTPPTN